MIKSLKVLAIPNETVLILINNTKDIWIKFKMC